MSILADIFDTDRQRPLAQIGKASPISAVINEFAPIVHHGTSKAPFEMGTTRIDLQRVT